MKKPCNPTNGSFAVPSNALPPPPPPGMTADLSRAACEGCCAPATIYDSEGTPLCQDCADACIPTLRDKLWNAKQWLKSKLTPNCLKAALVGYRLYINPSRAIRIERADLTAWRVLKLRLCGFKIQTL
jgi:hypothetical protein